MMWSASGQRLRLPRRWVLCWQRIRPRPIPSMFPTRRETRSRVLDSATLEVLETIPVGQRPRGIILTKDDKHLLICASDEDTVQVLDVATRRDRRRSAVRSRSRVARPASFGKPGLYRQRGRQSAHGDRPQRQEGAGRGGGRRRAGRGRRQSRRQDRGGDLRDHQHGAFHRHRELSRSPTTCWSGRGRASPSSRPTAAGSG